MPSRKNTNEYVAVVYLLLNLFRDRLDFGAFRSFPNESKRSEARQFDNWCYRRVVDSIGSF